MDLTWVTYFDLMEADWRDGGGASRLLLTVADPLGVSRLLLTVADPLIIYYFEETKLKCRKELVASCFTSRTIDLPIPSTFLHNHSGALI